MINFAPDEDHLRTMVVARKRVAMDCLRYVVGSQTRAKVLPPRSTVDVCRDVWTTLEADDRHLALLALFPRRTR